MIESYEELEIREWKLKKEIYKAIDTNNYFMTKKILISLEEIQKEKERR